MLLSGGLFRNYLSIISSNYNNFRIVYLNYSLVNEFSLTSRAHWDSHQDFKSQLCFVFFCVKRCHLCNWDLTNRQGTVQRRFDHETVRIPFMKSIPMNPSNDSKFSSRKQWDHVVSIDRRILSKPMKQIDGLRFDYSLIAQHSYARLTKQSFSGQPSDGCVNNKSIVVN